MKGSNGVMCSILGILELENVWSAEKIGIWFLFIGEKNKLHVLLKCKQAQRWVEKFWRIKR